MSLSKDEMVRVISAAWALAPPSRTSASAEYARPRIDPPQDHAGVAERYAAAPKGVKKWSYSSALRTPHLCVFFRALRVLEDPFGLPGHDFVSWSTSSSSWNP